LPCSVKPIQPQDPRHGQRRVLDPTGCRPGPERTIACSMVSTRRCTAPPPGSRDRGPGCPAARATRRPCGCRISALLTRPARTRGGGPPSRSCRVTLGPASLHQVGVPAQERSRCDEQVASVVSAASVQESREGGKDRPIQPNTRKTIKYSSRRAIQRSSRGEPPNAAKPQIKPCDPTFGTHTTGSDAPPQLPVPPVRTCRLTLACAVADADSAMAATPSCHAQNLYKSESPLNVRLLSWLPKEQEG
jgi:hypothetical protein